MICPKCGHEQSEKAECARCGLIISKYIAAAKQKSGPASLKIHSTKRISKKMKVLEKVIYTFIISIPVTFMILLWSAFHQELTTGEHLDSVSWLPPSATDISYAKRDGFGWIKNYTCVIPEEDFYALAADENWDLEAVGSIITYYKRHPNGGGASVHYNTGSQRLSVESNHR